MTKPPRLLLTLASCLLLALPGVASRATGQCLADVNADGLVDPSDFSAWVAAYNLHQPAADQNLDGLIDPSDFTAWVANYNSPCPEAGIVELWQGGGTVGLGTSFSRAIPARQPDGADVAPNQPRFGEEVLRVPLPSISPLFTNADLSSLHLGAGYSSSGELVQFNRLRDQASSASVIQATHGLDVTGDPTQPPPANARRYRQRMVGPPAPDDLLNRPVTTDFITPDSGAYFQDAYVVASSILRTGTPDRSGVMISVGNYTPANGLSGNAGTGDRLDAVFADIDARVGSQNHLREWSVLVFVIGENEVVFNVVDYTGGADNQSWAIMIRATRTAPGLPWSFGRPCVVFSKTDDNLVDHFHHMGSAVQSAAGVNPGALTQFASTGDVIDDQAMYIRTIREPSRYDELFATYTYGDAPLEIAFADSPAPDSFFTGLSRYELRAGASFWGEERNIFGRRDEDTPESILPWGAPQLIGCAPGPKRSQLLLGADRTNSHAVFAYDVDSFDPETESPYPEVWQRWGNASQFGVAVGDNGQSGLMTFRIFTPTPDAPEWYVADISHTNQEGSRTPESIMIGRATADHRVLFGKLAQDLPAQSFGMSADGRTIFTGGRFGSARIDLASDPEIVRPRLLGSGFRQFQPLYAAGPSPLMPEEEAGVDQIKNAELFDLEWRFGVTARFATDADLAALHDLGYTLPGLGPVYFVDYTEDAIEPFYLSADGFRTLPVRAELTRLFDDDIGASFDPIDGQAEVLFAILPVTEGLPRLTPLRLSFGDIGSGNPGVPGLDYNNLTVEGSDWSVFRLFWRDPDITSLSLRVSASNSVASGQVPVRFYLQILGVTAGIAGTYPMGYHGPPHTATTSPANPVIVGARTLPNERQSISPLGPAGTVAYHTVNDPHGVDMEYYRPLNNLGISADHALLSVVQDAQNSIEVGWTNGNFLYVKWAEPGQGTTTQLLDTDIGLQRQDDLKVSIRYDSTGFAADVWHNGNRISSGWIGTNHLWSAPTALLGSASFSQTIPVMAMSVGVVDQVLSDDDLMRRLERGELQSVP
ncbi:MAG: GC-type dockerin domain-anchored protein [Phycisphaerales bacterium]